MGTPSPPFVNSRFTSGGFGPRQPTSFQPSMGTLTKTRTYCLRRGEMGSPLHASSCRSLCVLAVEDALRAFQGP